MNGTIATSLFDVVLGRAERVEHADDLEGRAVVGDGLADGIASAEQLVGGVGTEHDDHGRRVLLVGR